MSWKTFGQIVLLIIITAIVFAATRQAIYYSCGFKGRPVGMHTMPMHTMPK